MSLSLPALLRRCYDAFGCLWWCDERLEKEGMCVNLYTGQVTTEWNSIKRIVKYE